ncbi:ABC transporter substrate-binding protein [Pseudomonas sp. DG56-2]|uniref:ABC transporter substrate-binding protein n=1 Tax=Pseudomonas sp. DG56-2 TaxID=2320270 RepID=UPI0010A5EF67|nr:ABC transporter substrate-binding protein [Pseudomonas sp. DG56-2]
MNSKLIFVIPVLQVFMVGCTGHMGVASTNCQQASVSGGCSSVTDINGNTGPVTPNVQIALDPAAVTSLFGAGKVPQKLNTDQLGAVKDYLQQQEATSETQRKISQVDECAAKGLSCTVVPE